MPKELGGTADGECGLAGLTLHDRPVCTRPQHTWAAEVPLGVPINRLAVAYGKRGGKRELNRFDRLSEALHRRALRIQEESYGCVTAWWP